MSEATARTTLRRLPQRGSHEREKLYALLDEGLVCHVGFGDAAGPVVIPTSYCRMGDRLVIHGSAASRMLRTLAQPTPACVVVTLLDGLVLARSAYHHSMNYRSAVIFGTAKLLEEREEKLAALRALTNHIIPDRWDDVRKPSELELKATSVLAISLDEFSVKERSGPPLDDEEDLGLPTWAGVIPLHLRAGTPVADSTLAANVPAPGYASDYRRPVHPGTTVTDG